jgi:hypothetical protein
VDVLSMHGGDADVADAYVADALCHGAVGTWRLAGDDKSRYWETAWHQPPDRPVAPR